APRFPIQGTLPLAIERSTVARWYVGRAFATACTAPGNMVIGHQRPPMTERPKVIAAIVGRSDTSSTQQPSAIPSTTSGTTAISAVQASIDPRRYVLTDMPLSKP